MPETITSQGPKGVTEILNAAADLLEKPGAWTQGAAGRTSTGRCADTDKLPKNPVCFCVVGAVLHTLGERVYRPYGPAHKALDTLSKVNRIGHVPTWNDSPKRTQDEVVAALRKAASKSESPNV